MGVTRLGPRWPPDRPTTRRASPTPKIHQVMLIHCGYTRRVEVALRQVFVPGAGPGHSEHCPLLPPGHSPAVRPPSGGQSPGWARPRHFGQRGREHLGAGAEDQHQDQVSRWEAAWLGGGENGIPGGVSTQNKGCPTSGCLLLGPAMPWTRGGGHIGSSIPWLDLKWRCLRSCPVPRVFAR